MFYSNLLYIYAAWEFIHNLSIIRPFNSLLIEGFGRQKGKN